MSSNRADNVTDPVRSKNSIALDIIGREFPRSPGVRFFMQTGLDPFRFVIIAVAGWMNQHQQHAIDYLQEENRVLREQIGSRRIRFSDDQRYRLAAKAKKLGRKLLAEIPKSVTPETLIACFKARPFTRTAPVAEIKTRHARSRIPKLTGSIAQ